MVKFLHKIELDEQSIRWSIRLFQNLILKKILPTISNSIPGLQQIAANFSVGLKGLVQLSENRESTTTLFCKLFVSQNLDPVSAKPVSTKPGLPFPSETSLADPILVDTSLALEYARICEQVLREYIPENIFTSLLKFFEILENFYIKRFRKQEFSVLEAACSKAVLESLTSNVLVALGFGCCLVYNYLHVNFNYEKIQNPPGPKSFRLKYLLYPPHYFSRTRVVKLSHEYKCSVSYICTNIYIFRRLRQIQVGNLAIQFFTIRSVEIIFIVFDPVAFLTLITISAAQIPPVLPILNNSQFREDGETMTRQNWNHGLKSEKIKPA